MAASLRVKKIPQKEVYGLELVLDLDYVVSIFQIFNVDQQIMISEHMVLIIQPFFFHLRSFDETN